MAHQTWPCLCARRGRGAGGGRSEASCKPRPVPETQNTPCSPSCPRGPGRPPGVLTIGLLGPRSALQTGCPPHLLPTAPTQTSVQDRAVDMLSASCGHMRAELARGPWSGDTALPGHKGPGSSCSPVWNLAGEHLGRAVWLPRDAPPPLGSSLCNGQLLVHGLWGLPRAVVRGAWHLQSVFHLPLTLVWAPGKGTPGHSLREVSTGAPVPCPGQEPLKSHGSL